jgi:hypothetical protein
VFLAPRQSKLDKRVFVFFTHNYLLVLLKILFIRLIAFVPHFSQKIKGVGG